MKKKILPLSKENQKRRVLNGRKNILIGRMNNGTKFVGVTRLGHNQESILLLGLLAELEKRRYITLTVYNYNQVINERVDRCFRGQ